MTKKNVYFGLEKLDNSDGARAIAIGNFDGVHIGHQAVLSESIMAANQQGLVPTALTFEPHPKDYFSKSNSVMRLMTPSEKYAALHEVGIDDVVVLEFNAELSAVSAHAFIQDILFNELGAKQISVGNDFKFGKSRLGDTELLASECAANSVEFRAINKISSIGDMVVSSSRIRECLASGDIKTVSKLLGKPWHFSSIVQHGDKRGRELGYPTANLVLRDDIKLSHGIYAVFTTVKGKRFGGVASYGRRPVFDNGRPLFEVFIFDYSGDIYGEAIKIELIDWQRPELNFDSIDALIDQMHKDSEQAQQTLSLL